MSIPVECPCGNPFDAEDALAGGFVNCPRCGRANAVQGLRDPAWRALQVGALALGVLVTAVAWDAGGAAAGLATGVALALLFWLLSRAL